MRTGAGRRLVTFLTAITTFETCGIRNVMDGMDGHRKLSALPYRYRSVGKMPGAGTQALLLLLARHTLRDREDLVRVASFNINSINKRLDNLLVWLATSKPDVVSLQELKA